MNTKVKERIESRLKNFTVCESHSATYDNYFYISGLIDALKITGDISVNEYFEFGSRLEDAHEKAIERINSRDFQESPESYMDYKTDGTWY